MMHKLFSILTLAGLLFSTGCAKNEPPKRDGFELHAPGVDIKINSQDGVEVKAPGTEVRASKDRGVQVKAPNTAVDIEPAKPNANP